jgi:hypothetical protein
MTTNLTTDRRPLAARKPQTERQSGVEVIAARILTVAVVALVVIALYGFTLADSPTALIVSGVFGVAAAVIGLVVGFLNAHRAA